MCMCMCVHACMRTHTRPCWKRVLTGEEKLNQLIVFLLYKGLQCNYFLQASLGRPGDSTTPSKNISYKNITKKHVGTLMQ